MFSQCCHSITQYLLIQGVGIEGGVQSNFDFEFRFHGKFWINITNVGYRIDPKYSYTKAIHNTGRVKRKSAFDHAHKHIKIILRALDKRE